MSRKLENEARKLVGKNHGKGGKTTEKLLGNMCSIAKFMATQGLQSIHHCKTKHVTKFFAHLKELRMSASTMANYATAMRRIAHAIDKQNIVPSNIELGICREDRYAPKTADLDGMQAIRERLYEKAEWLGLAADLRRHFGLRLKESLLSVETFSEDGLSKLIVRGSKGNRPRSLPIETPDQEQTVAKIQTHLLKTGGSSLIPPHLSLKEGYKKASNALYRSGARKANGTNSHLDRHNIAQQMRAAGASDQEIAEYLGHGRRKSVKHYCK